MTGEDEIPVCRVMLDTCRALPGYTGRNSKRHCGSPASEMIRVGCIHEHISEGPICASCLQHGNHVCVKCLTAGHRCTLMVEIISDGGGLP